jgi:G6PDH family F420-dependent oxidoreductase
MIAGSERFRSFSSYFAMRERRGDLAEELVASSASSLRRPTSPTAEPAVSPWLEEQGHAPLAWPVLGAIANATNRIGLMTAVTCPLMRYHPAVIAQGTATLALLSGSLGLGSGERLNEHVIGARWPGRVEWRERFGEAIDVIQGLLGGNLTNCRGRYYQLLAFSIARKARSASPSPPADRMRQGSPARRATH